MDTNALLVPFNTGSEAISAIRDTYERLAREGRLVIPGHVVREFAANRPTKLADLFKSIQDKRNGINLRRHHYPLLDESPAYMKVLEIEASLSRLADEYSAAIRSLSDEIQAWTWDDPVSAMYRQVLPSAVYDPAFDTAAVNHRHTEAVRHRLPPGYKDSGKDLNGDGDLRLWLTILELAKSRKEHVILVSGDEKSDWRHRSNNRGLYPRFELVDEFRRSSEGKSFHICSFSDFLKRFDVNEAVVNEVKSSEITLQAVDMSAAASRSELWQANPALRAFRAEQAVYEWLIAAYPYMKCLPASQAVTPRGLDFLLTDQDGKTRGVVVKYLSKTPVALAKVWKIVDYVRRSIVPTEEVWLFLVAAHEAAFLELLVLTSERPAQEQVRLILTLLRDDDTLDVRDTLNALPPPSA